MKIGIASDHRGYPLKEWIIQYLKGEKYEVKDYGTANEERTDYPVYAKALCIEMGKEIEKGILICGTGIGMSIAANKIKGIRCARIVNKEEAEIVRKHNNANVIALGENTPKEEIKEMIQSFLHTDFLEEESYQRREKQLTEIENEYESDSVLHHSSHCNMGTR